MQFWVTAASSILVCHPTLAYLTCSSLRRLRRSNIQHGWALVTVGMVHVGHMRMNVHNWAMLVPMGVRFARWVFWPMLVLMMFIM